MTKRIQKRIFSVMWEFRVPARRRHAFENAYGPRGTWAQLFRTGEGYIRTDLLHHRVTPGRYLTIDYWKSKRHFLEFKKHKRAEYEALDERCAELTEKEERLGEFETQEPE